jgi:hypothetical protein
MAIKLVSVTPNHGARGAEVKVEIAGTGFEPPAHPVSPPATSTTSTPPPPPAAPVAELLTISGGDVAVSHYAYVSPTLITATLSLPVAPKLPLLRDVTFGGDTLKGGFIVD